MVAPATTDDGWVTNANCVAAPAPKSIESFTVLNPVALALTVYVAAVVAMK